MQTERAVRPPDDRPDGGSNLRMPQHSRRRFVAIAVAAAVAIVAAIGFATIRGADDDESQPSVTAPPPSEAPTRAPSKEAPAPTESDAGGGAGTTAPPATAPSAEPVLEDGRHAVYLTGLDLGERSVEFDVIQFLTGDAAIAAWDEAHPDEPGGPPNDYFIVNENPRLRRLPVAESVQVAVPDFDGGFHARAIAFAELSARFAGDPIPDDGRIWPNPFWLTVVDDTITAIDEQYVP